MSTLCFRMLLLSCLALAAGPAAAASFDCAKARTSMETTICADPALSTLDEQLAASYKRAQNVSGAKAAVTRSQRAWLGSPALGLCGDAACYREAFSARIALLNGVAPATDPAANWNGVYQRHRNGRPDPNTANLVVVGLNGGRLLLSGNAIWLGANAAKGQVNVGAIDGVASVRGGNATFDGDGCHAELALKAQVLTVVRDADCGGLNVSFAGDYRRK